jgi:rhodanese-related sulfurtransferase
MYELFVPTLLAVCIAGQAQAGSASHQTRLPVGAWAAQQPRAYCGVCCLYRTLQALNKNVPFEELLRPEYVSSNQGSTADDLERAAVHYDLCVMRVKRMTCRMLEELNAPAIIHVKSSLGPKPYDHWVLYLGTEYGKARIYDGTRDCNLVDFGEIRAAWDGNALLVSDKKINIWPVWGARATGLLWLAAIVLGTIATLKVVEDQLEWTLRMRRASYAARTLKQTAALAIAITAMGTACYLINPTESLAHAPSIARIKDAHLTNFLPRVEAKTVELVMKEDGATLIDARLSKDYETAYIGNATNIPVNMPQSEFDKVCKSLHRSNRIVIYCQSMGCPFSGVVAQRLRASGYDRISLYPGGWRDWEQYRQPKSGR